MKFTKTLTLHNISTLLAWNINWSLEKGFALWYKKVSNFALAGLSHWTMGSRRGNSVGKPRPWPWCSMLPMKWLSITVSSRHISLVWVHFSLSPSQIWRPHRHWPTDCSALSDWDHDEEKQDLSHIMSPSSLTHISDCVFSHKVLTRTSNDQGAQASCTYDNLRYASCTGYINLHCSMLSGCHGWSSTVGHRL